MRLVMLGGPGAGKGTQFQRLSQKLHLKGISTSEVLREEIAQTTELGLKAQAYVARGELVPDELIIEFMRQRLLKPDVTQGWILEGYPRTAFQAEELDFLLDDLGQQLNWAIYLEVREEVMQERSLARGRSDDQLEVILRRVEMFKERTIPLLEYYEHRNRLLTINGERSPELVEQDLIKQLFPT